jgi:hypothetical protein
MGSEMAESGTKTARKRGPKPGSPKTGGAGYYAPPPGLKGQALRAWLLDKSGALENLVKLSCGRPIRLYGPTGKVRFHYPDVAQTMWAIERILKKALPDLAGLQLSGDQDSPIRTQHINDSSLGKDAELSRRLALLQGTVGAPPEPVDAPTNGRPTNGHDTSVLPPDQPGESANGHCSPAIGEAFDFDSDRNITITRLSDDSRDDHGGDFEVRVSDQPIRTLRGITFDNARAVVEAMIETGKIDG